MHLERSGQSQIELPRAGAENAAGAQIARPALRRISERRGTEVVLKGLGAIDVFPDLIDALVGDASAHRIPRGSYAHVAARKNFENRGEAPARCNCFQRGTGKLRGLGYSRCIEDVPPIPGSRCAVPTFQTPDCGLPTRHAFTRI